MNTLMKIIINLDTTETFLIILLLLFASFILFFSAFNSTKDKEDMIKRITSKKYKNLSSLITEGSQTEKFTSLSYSAPFKWFIDETETSKQAVNINQKIIDAQLYQTLNYRSFTVIKFIVSTGSLILMIILLKLLEYTPHLFPAFNLTAKDLIDAKIFVLFFTGLLALFPSIQLSNMAKSIKAQRTKDLPVLQLFLILSLKTGKTIREILYTLSTLNTRYVKIFRTAFIIHLRNEKECFEYLLEEFKDTQFEFTIKCLSDMEYYSKKDTISLLENTLEDIINENKTKQEKKNLINLFLTQGTLILPLLAIGLLVLYPIISYISGNLSAVTF